jgi:hypothetical protein
VFRFYSSLSTQCPMSTPIGNEASVQAVRKVSTSLGRKCSRKALTPTRTGAPSNAIGPSDLFSLHISGILPDF